MNNNRLQMRFALLAADYIEAFTAKQKLDFDGWVGDDVGGIATFGDISFNFDDIRYDIDHSVRKGLIIKWYYADLQHNHYRSEKQHINYSSYCKGLRHKDLGKKKRFTAKRETGRMAFCNTCEKITVFDNGVCTECNN